MPANSSATSITGSKHGDVISGNGSGNTKTLTWIIIAAAVIVVVWLFTRK